MTKIINHKVLVYIALLGIITYVISHVMFSIYLIILITVLTLVTGITALISAAIHDYNHSTPHHLSSALTLFIVISGVITKLSDGMDIFTLDLLYVHVRFMVIFMIIKGMILGVNIENTKISSFISIIIDVVVIILFMTVISVSSESVQAFQKIKHYSAPTLFANMAVLFTLLISLYKTKRITRLTKTHFLLISLMLYLSDAVFVLPVNSNLKVLVSQILVLTSYTSICVSSIQLNVLQRLELLKKQRESFTTMFMTATDPIILFKANNNQWVVDVANRAVSDILSYDMGEMSGILVRSLFADPEDFDALDLSNPVQLELKMKSKNDNLIYSKVSLHNFEILGMVQHLMVVRDLTEVIYNKDKVSLFETMFLNASEAMFITNKQGEIQWINKYFENLYDYDQSIINKRVSVLKSGVHDAQFYRDMWRSIRETGQWTGEIWNRARSGDLIPVNQNIFVIPGNHPDFAYASISYDLTDSKLMDNKIYELAFIDSDLQIKNRNSILEQAEISTDTTVYLITVSDLKNMELRFGTDISVQLMRQIFDILSEKFDRNHIYKYSENTFALLIPRTKSSPVDTIANSLLKVLGIPYEISTVQLSPTIHIGVSGESEGSQASIEQLAYEAESALSAAKKSQQSAYVVFDTSIEASQIKSYDMLKAVENAVKNDEFEVYFQPIVDLFSGSLFSFEALSRWSYKGQAVSPVEFIELAEKNNFIYDLGLQILRASCLAVVSWKNILPNIKVNVNVSLLQLEDTTFVQSLKKILLDTNCSPSDLIIEITESISSLSNPTIDQTIYDLHALGIIFALDDFGTGFSSIQRLKRMPISIAKVDHDFTRDIHENIDDTSVLTGMISMSHKIGLNVIVEGVENLSQLRIIRSRNCRYVQGYYFSKPINEAQTLEYIKSYNPDDVINEQLSVDLTPVQEMYDENVLGNNNIGTAILDIEGFIVDANRNFSSIIGENQSDVLGESINSFISQSDNHDIVIQAKMDEDVKERSGTVRRLDGTLRHVIYSLYTDYDPTTSQTYIRCLVEDITENLDDGLRLMRIRQGYEKIFRNAPVMILTWNKDYKIQEWNQIAEVILGFTAQEVIEKPIFDTFVSDTDFMQWRAFVDLTLTGRESKETLNVVDATGITHICECNNEIVRSSSGDIDFVITIMKDITSQLLAQERSDSLLSVIDNGPALVFMCRKNGDIWYRSKACLDISPLKSVTNIDDLALSYFDHLDNEIEPPNRDRVDMWTSTGSLLLSDEKEKRIRITIFKDKLTKLQDDLFIYIFMDFTNEYEQVNSVKHLRNIILDQERLAELGHLSASISHEINNPLSYMISSSDILRAELNEMYELVQMEHNEKFDYLKKDIIEILADFDDGLQRIKSIITGLRSYSWGTKSDEFMHVDLNSIIDKVLTIAINEVKYTAVIDVSLGNLPNIDAIESKISQVIMNLIINASQAIERKKMNKLGIIKVNTSADDNYVYCIIEDNGVGMTPEAVEQIFDPYLSKNMDTMDNGLGLSISHEIVQDMHHGSLQVKSQLNEGSKYIITLPQQQPNIPN